MIYSGLVIGPWYKTPSNHNPYAKQEEIIMPAPPPYLSKPLDSFKVKYSNPVYKVSKKKRNKQSLMQTLQKSRGIPMMSKWSGMIPDPKTPDDPESRDRPSTGPSPNQNVVQSGSDVDSNSTMNNDSTVKDGELAVPRYTFEMEEDKDFNDVLENVVFKDGDMFYDAESGDDKYFTADNNIKYPVVTPAKESEKPIHYPVIDFEKEKRDLQNLVGGYVRDKAENILEKEKRDFLVSPVDYLQEKYSKLVGKPIDRSKLSSEVTKLKTQNFISAIDKEIKANGGGRRKSEGQIGVTKTKNYHNPQKMKYDDIYNDNVKTIITKDKLAKAPSVPLDSRDLNEYRKFLTADNFKSGIEKIYTSFTKSAKGPKAPSQAKADISMNSLIPKPNPARAAKRKTQEERILGIQEKVIKNQINQSGKVKKRVSKKK